MGKLTLIMGGSNSGKSKFAEGLLGNYQNVLYLATAEPFDEEMKAKIEQHRQSRPREWVTKEEPVHFDKVMEKEKGDFTAILVECMLLYVNNILLKYPSLSGDDVEKMALEIIGNALEIIRNSKFDCYMISGEAGLGLIGESKVSRRYARVLGMVNQLLAQNAEDVYFVIAGIPTKIK